MSTSETFPSSTVAGGKQTARLFEPLQIRDVLLQNRAVVSPMCQYSAEGGFANDWHLVHLGSRAVGGAGLVIVEATAVEDRGRITPSDLGIWTDQHIEPLARITRFIKKHSASVSGIQLAHAGRKASTDAPWRGGKPVAESDGGWKAVAPSPIPFSDGDAPPAELSVQEIRAVVESFQAAARRALQAGFEIVEIHGAHGYLLHEFLSPLSNKRSDEYGGPFENRTRIVVEVVKAVRAVWPERLPLFLRISATDWVENGWDPDQSVELARLVKPLGVDLIDCSSGALVPKARIPAKPGFQVPFAERIKKEAGILTGAVGLITDPQQAEDIVRNEQADLVFLARELLRDPYWPIHAAEILGGTVFIPDQYARAFPNDDLAR
ncbi:MAG TPA: NADPH dehydrogenase NamA [Bryobacteraceae bacterium]|nr:NADPH dehydrogenase NamA [Bryobacteraceae bacterium]